MVNEKQILEHIVEKTGESEVVVHGTVHVNKKNNRATFMYRSAGSLLRKYIERTGIKKIKYFRDNPAIEVSARKINKNAAPCKKIIMCLDPAYGHLYKEDFQKLAHSH